MKYSGAFSNTEGANGLKSSLNFTYLLSLFFKSISLGSERIEREPSARAPNSNLPWNHPIIFLCATS